MVKAIIFDLDGTLLDTSKDIHAVLNESLRRFNLPEISYAKTVEYVGNGAKILVERAVGAENSDRAEEVYRDYSKRFAECDNGLTSLYEGETAALNAFKERGIKLAVITNKPQNATENVIKKFFGNGYFDAVIGNSEAFALKPDKASTEYVIHGFGVDRAECLFVGDGETDVATARNAGIKCVSVLWGFRSKSQLAAAGAKYFADKFKELENFVRNF